MGKVNIKRGLRKLRIGLNKYKNGNPLMLHKDFDIGLSAFKKLTPHKPIVSIKKSGAFEKSVAEVLLGAVIIIGLLSMVNFISNIFDRDD
jgi:hypothetical protein